jgi:transcriptional regulator with XRE-family HTH domain
MTFGERMRALMAERGIGVRQLATMVPCSPGYLSRVSRDLKRPSGQMAAALDKALDADGELVALVPGRTSMWTAYGTTETYAALTPDDEERLLLAAQRPARLDRSVIEALTTTLAAQRRLEDAMGPATLVMPLRSQLDMLTAILREARGPLRDPLGRIVAEWTEYTGWLHAACRIDDRALAFWVRAVELADDFNNGAVAAHATAFPGYLALRQKRYRGVLRASHAALATPGIHPAQDIYFSLRIARAHAAIRDHAYARRLIDDAAGRVDTAGHPPPVAYWCTSAYIKTYLGIALYELRAYSDAVDLLRSGLAEMPEEQRGTEWMREAREALATARDRA